MNKTMNIVLCGVGGQGTVLASKILSAAAMNKGLQVMSAETIGMAQRGGSVFSQLRTGEEIYSPMIANGTADIIIGFEPGETVRMLPYLKEGGQIIVSSRPVIPVGVSLGESNYNPSQCLEHLQSVSDNVLIVDTDAALEELGSAKVLNVVMLGAALASGALDFSEDELKAVLVERLPERLHELNFRALSYAKGNL